MNDVTPKPYTKTSYFWIMVLSIVLGPPLLWFTAWLAPDLPLSDAQRGQLIQTAFQGWLAIVGLTTAGNVGARGLVTILKTFLQNQPAFLPSTPADAGSADAVGANDEAASPEIY